MLTAVVESIGQRIEHALGRLGKKDVWLAAQLDVNQGTVRRWIRNDRAPRIDQAVPMADALGVSVRWLLTGEGDETPTGDVAPGGAPERIESRDGPNTWPRERRRGVPDRRKKRQG